MGVIVFVATASAAFNENLLIGLAVLGLFGLTALGFIIKGIIGKVVGGR